MATVPIPPEALSVLVSAVRDMQDADHAARLASDTARTVRSRAVAIDAALRAVLTVGTDATLDMEHACFVVPDAPTPDGVAP